MKLLFIIFFMSSFAYGTSENIGDPDPLNFDYLPSTYLINPQLKDQFLTSFSRLSSNELTFIQVSRNTSVDGLLTSKDLSQTVLVKFGYTPSKAKLNNTFISTSFGYLFHGLMENGAPFAIMFNGFSKTEARKMIMQINRHTTDISPPSFKDVIRKTVSHLFISSAHASDNNCDPERGDFLQQISGILNTVKNEGLECLFGIFAGLVEEKDSAVNFVKSIPGTVANIPHAVGNTLMHPIQSAEKLWMKAGKMLRGMWAFLRDLKTTLGNVTKLPAEELCKLALHIGKDVLLTYLTLGVATPAILGRIYAVLYEMKGVALLTSTVAMLLSNYTVVMIRYASFQKKWNAAVTAAERMALFWENDNIARNAIYINGQITLLGLAGTTMASAKDLKKLEKMNAILAQSFENERLLNLTGLPRPIKAIR